MTDMFSERRLAENEVIFRELNERIKTEVEHALMNQVGGLKLGFYCECSNDQCRERIAMAPRDYSSIHSTPKLFVVRKGHQEANIERVVQSYDDYDVVEKFLMPPQVTDSQLNPTGI